MNSLPSQTYALPTLAEDIHSARWQSVCEDIYSEINDGEWDNDLSELMAEEAEQFFIDTAVAIANGNRLPEMGFVSQQRVEKAIEKLVEREAQKRIDSIEKELKNEHR